MVDTLKASEDGLKIVDEARRKKGWQKNSLKWIEEGKTSEATIKRFWRKLAIDRFTFIAICQAVGVNWKEVAELSEIQEIELPVVSPVKDTPPIPNQNFIGRENAIAHLKTKINQGAKIILIQATAGIGKTTLATEFLKNQNFDKILYLTMAKERETISPIETIVEEWLKKDFEEEPGRDFMVSLGRLKRLLQNQKIGILIDNLEPALDSEFRFIQPHRRYIELLRMLTDPMVQSVTLITSRERLCEGDITVETYRLPELDYCAWKQYFEYYQINNYDSILTEMHKAYGGNAKAMRILCGAIQEDDQGDIQSYWNCNKAEILAKPDLKDLVNSQFKRLQELDINAFKLLCRLGCYRYQDVPTVPDNGLLCLLWDVPEGEQRRVVESLKNRSLVEFNKGEFFLHPMVREEAIARLRKSEDWETANIKAAEFWTDFIDTKSIKNYQECIKKLEAFYHYTELGFWENAAQVLESDSSNTNLLSRLRCFGYIEKSINFINLLLNTNNLSNSIRGGLYGSLGDLYSICGKVKQAITAYRQAIDFETYPRPTFYVDVLGALAYLYIAIGEYQQSINLFESLISPAEELQEEGNEFLAYINACLSFSYYQIGNCEKSLIYLKNAMNFKIALEKSHRTWIVGYGLYSLGKTMIANNCLEEANKIYKKLNYFQEKSFKLFQGLAINGEAELYRKQGNFELALLHHSEAVEIFDKIDAKCDLAEAYYQQALTYQQMGERENSKPNFDNAIQLFTEIEAPLQVERVIKSIINE